MSGSNNPSGGAISDQELEQRLAKLKDTQAASDPPSDRDLALRFSEVFGQSPVPGLSSQSAIVSTDVMDDRGSSNMASTASLYSQMTTASYSVPVGSDVDQDTIDKLLEEFQDDLGYLDELDHQQSSVPKQTTIEREFESTAENLEKKLSTMLQTDPSSSKGLAFSTGEQSERERTFGNQLDRLAGISLETHGASDHEVAGLIAQARDAAQLETAYGNQEEARLKELNARHEELRKGMQGLSSLVQPTTTSQNTKSTGDDVGLGPPPMAVDLDELMSGGLRGSGNDDNPDNWCCICNEDAVWTCPGCDDDNYCAECFREGHNGPDADWELKKHRPRPFAKARTNS